MTDVCQSWGLRRNSYKSTCFGGGETLMSLRMQLFLGPLPKALLPFIQFGLSSVCSKETLVHDKAVGFVVSIVCCVFWLHFDHHCLARFQKKTLSTLLSTSSTASKRTGTPFTMTSMHLSRAVSLTSLSFPFFRILQLAKRTGILIFWHPRGLIAHTSTSSSTSQTHHPYTRHYAVHSTRP